MLGTSVPYSIVRRFQVVDRACGFEGRDPQPSAADPTCGQRGADRGTNATGGQYEILGKRDSGTAINVPDKPLSDTRGMPLSGIALSGCVAALLGSEIPRFGERLKDDNLTGEVRSNSV